MERDCNLPWAKAPAYGMVKGNGPGKKGGRNGKTGGETSYHLSEEGADDSTTNAQWAGEQSHHNNASAESVRSESEATTIASVQEEDAFTSQWREEDIAMMTAGQETCSPGLLPLPTALIDSGASSNVAGIEGIRAWSKLNDDSRISSISASMNRSDLEMDRYTHRKAQ